MRVYDIWVEHDSGLLAPDPTLGPSYEGDFPGAVEPPTVAALIDPSASPKWRTAVEPSLLDWSFINDPFLGLPGEATSLTSVVSPTIDAVPPSHVPPVDLGDVVITGDSDLFWWFSGVVWSWYHIPSGTVGDGPLPDGSYNPPAQDPEPAVVQDGKPESQPATVILAKAVDAADQEIDLIPDAQVFPMPDGRTLTGAEIKAIWHAMTFIVTSGIPYGEGRAGKNDDGVVSIDSAAIGGYAAHGSAGTNYLLLHELAHETPSGKAYDQSFFDSYKERTGDIQGNLYGPDDPEFLANERHANEIARGIATATLLSFIPAPPHGYPGTPT